MTVEPGRRYRLGRLGYPVMAIESTRPPARIELKGSWARWFVVGDQVCTYGGRNRNGHDCFNPTGLTVEDLECDGMH